MRYRVSERVQYMSPERHRRLALQELAAMRRSRRRGRYKYVTPMADYDVLSGRYASAARRYTRARRSR